MTLDVRIGIYDFGENNLSNSLTLVLRTEKSDDVFEIVISRVEAR